MPYKDPVKRRESVRRNTRLYRERNRELLNVKAKNYYWKNRKKVLKRKRKEKLLSQLKNFNLSIDHYKKLKEKQNGLCGICKGKPTRRKGRLSLDHEHNTGILRGLICDRCNLALGHIRGSLKTAKNMIKYLEKTSVRKKRMGIS